MKGDLMKGDLKVNGLAMECDIVMLDTIKMFGGRTDWTKECLVLDLSQSGRDHAREGALSRFRLLFDY